VTAFLCRAVDNFRAARPVLLDRDLALCEATLEDLHGTLGGAGPLAGRGGTGGEAPPIRCIIIHIMPPIMSSIMGTMTINQTTPMPPSCIPHLSASGMICARFHDFVPPVDDHVVRLRRASGFSVTDRLPSM
jgi:hypothetical protein